MTRLVCISDTHERHREMSLPDGDILIHAGDWTYTGEPKAVLDFLDWFSSQPHKHKVFIAGNHEVTLDSSMEEMYIARRFGMFGDFSRLREIISKPISGVHYLFDREVVLEGLRIYGSPWQPAFGGWGFNRQRGEDISRAWRDIPTGVDILVTHGPAYGCLDKLETFERVGCSDLLQEIEDRIKPRVHIFGHIHCSYGVLENNGVTYINASSCGEDYQIRHAPIVYDI